MSVIRFKSELKKLPTTSVKCYQFKEPEVTEESGRKIANAFGIPEEVSKQRTVIEKNEFGYVFRNFQQYLSIDSSSGAIEYRNFDTFNKDLGKAIDFSDDDAVEIAKKKIRKLEFISLRDCHLLKIKHLTMGNTDLATKTTTSRIVNVSVIFQRIVDKIPVEGPGGKLAVVLDANSKMCGLHRVWRDISPEESIEVKPDELQPIGFAKDDLDRKFKKFKDLQIEVFDQNFAYWEMGEHESQKYLQPTVVTKLDFVGPGGITFRKSVHVVPAAKNPMPGMEFNKPKNKVRRTHRSET